MTRKVFWFIFLLSFLGLSSFAGGKQEAGQAGGGEREPEGPVKVFVSILPQRYFVEQIGGDLADAEVLVKPGQSPHSYEPTPSQVMALGEADILFTIGVDFEEAFLPEIRSSLPDLTIVETQQGIALRELESHGHDEDEHHEDEHEGNDPHVWLSLENGKIIAENVKNALTAADPANIERYEANYRDLIGRIGDLHAELDTFLAPVRGEKILVFHPAFGYFADEYGLVQEAIETGGKEPSPKQLDNIISEAKAEGVRVIFVQPQFSKTSAQVIADAIGGAVVAINPLAPDWFSNMRTIADTVRTGLIE